MNRFSYWKDSTGKYFRTKTPFVEHYNGLKSITEHEYIAHKLENSRSERSKTD